MLKASDAIDASLPSVTNEDLHVSAAILVYPAWCNGPLPRGRAIFRCGGSAGEWCETGIDEILVVFCNDGDSCLPIVS